MNPIDNYLPVASVVNGSIASVGNKGITGVFKGGISVIDIVDGGAAIVNNVQTFGSTNDGTPFLVTESGIGNAADDFARLVRVDPYFFGFVMTDLCT